MLTMTITKRLYRLDELSETAKSRAHIEFMGFDYQDYSDIEHTLNEAARMFDFEVRNYDFGYRGSGITYRLNCSDEVEELKGKRLLSYVWNNFQSLWQGKYYSKFPKSRRSNAIKSIDDSPLTGYYADNAVTDVVKALWEHPVNPNYSYADLVQDIVYAIETYWFNEVEYYESYEHFEEEVENNDWVFTEDGSEIHNASEAVECDEEEEEEIAL